MNAQIAAVGEAPQHALHLAQQRGVVRIGAPEAQELVEREELVRAQLLTIERSQGHAFARRGLGAELQFEGDELAQERCPTRARAASLGWPPETRG